jgi:hypothetical protein
MRFIYTKNLNLIIVLIRSRFFYDARMTFDVQSDIDMEVRNCETRFRSSVAGRKETEGVNNDKCKMFSIKIDFPL